MNIAMFYGNIPLWMKYIADSNSILELYVDNFSLVDFFFKMIATKTDDHCRVSSLHLLNVLLLSTIETWRNSNKLYGSFLINLRVLLVAIMLLITHSVFHKVFTWRDTLLDACNIYVINLTVVRRQTLTPTTLSGRLNFIENGCCLSHLRFLC